MKRVLFLLLVLFPMSIMAIENDELYIDELETSIMFLSNDVVRVKENYKLDIIYSSNPSIYYFNRNIGTDFEFKYGKTYKYKVESKLLDYKGRNFVYNDENGLKVKYGYENIHLDPNYKYYLEYDAILKDKETGFNIYYIGGFDYDVRKIKFNVSLPYLNDDTKVILFSMDGKKFKEKLDNLETEVKSSTLLTGEYYTTLKKGEKLYILTYDKDKVEVENETIFKIDTKLIIIISIIVVCIISLVILIKRKNH